MYEKCGGLLFLGKQKLREDHEAHSTPFRHTNLIVTAPHEGNGLTVRRAVKEWRESLVRVSRGEGKGTFNNPARFRF